MEVQGVGFCVFSAKGMGLILGGRTNIPLITATQHSQKKKSKLIIHIWASKLIEDLNRKKKKNSASIGKMELFNRLSLDWNCSISFLGSLTCGSILQVLGLSASIIV